MSLVAASLMLTAAYLTPSPAKDVESFLRFMWGNERCPGININYGKTLEQVRDLATILKWDDDTRQQKILFYSSAARSEYKRNKGDFCVAVRGLYHSYDPAYLKQVGVID